ncbi:MAG: TatD family hydrolase [Chloroflexi bacterium]|nr:TatD family hydrolase [Chloroflexota bacterium]
MLREDSFFSAYTGYSIAINIRDVIKNTSQDRLMVESDRFFLPSQGYRGKRGEPVYLPLAVGLLARIRQVPPEIIV